MQNSRIPLQDGTDGVNCGVWAIYTTMMWEEFLANLERNVSRECDFTTFLRDQPRPKVSLLRSRYLRDMKRMRGIQVEAPLVVDTMDQDPEACIMIDEGMASQDDLSMPHCNRPVHCIGPVFSTEDGSEDINMQNECVEPPSMHRDGPVLLTNDGSEDINIQNEHIEPSSMHCDGPVHSTDGESEDVNMQNEHVEPSSMHCDGPVLSTNDINEDINMLNECVEQGNIEQPKKQTKRAKLSPDIFLKLYDKYNGGCDNVKAVARAIHAHLGNNYDLKLYAIEQKIKLNERNEKRNQRYRQAPSQDCLTNTMAFVAM